MLTRNGAEISYTLSVVILGIPQRNQFTSPLTPHCIIKETTYNKPIKETNLN